MRVLILIITLFLAINSFAQIKELKKNKDDNSLLWQVSGNGLQQPSYLFGTFHLMCKDDIVFSEQLKQALVNSDTLYLELNLSDPVVYFGGLKMVYMKDGKTLKDLYNDSDYNKIKTYFHDSLSIALGAVQNMKPELIIALLYPQLLKCKKADGVEEGLMHIAKENKKPIRGLETIEFQSAIFDSIPYEEQAKDLLQTIDSINKYSDEFNQMLLTYKAQQLKQLETLITGSDFTANEHDDILLYDRNRNWVGQLKSKMQGKSIFVAVGAAHLLGEKGLIKLLQKEGYSVIPLLNK
ncbi:TraB/GumN family protein [Ferruginibacter albus]|uniref:TraB/GumN family protein n=1 Tax=Ferruginibacter albus TaxID=2875540 RepID=UPI001CC56708|nr:TraB/GumN family protein [Ferruginibacter albus]UAY50923.1 TraB/GumN family protein [Ferruginibacter albus]